MSNNLEDIRKNLLTYIHMRKQRRTQDWARDIGITAKELIAFFMNTETSEETVKKIKEYLIKNS